MCCNFGELAVTVGVGMVIYCVKLPNVDMHKRAVIGFVSLSTFLWRLLDKYGVCRESLAVP